MKQLLLLLVVVCCVSCSSSIQSHPDVRMYRILDKPWGCATCTGTIIIAQREYGFHTGDTILSSPSRYTTQIILDTIQ